MVTMVDFPSNGAIHSLRGDVESNRQSPRNNTYSCVPLAHKTTGELDLWAWKNSGIMVLQRRQFGISLSESATRDVDCDVIYWLKFDTFMNISLCLPTSRS